MIETTETTACPDCGSPRRKTRNTESHTIVILCDWCFDHPTQPSYPCLDCGLPGNVCECEEDEP